MTHRWLSYGVLSVACCAAALCGAAGAEGLPPLPEGAFSIVALPDTQQYSAQSPEVFEALIRWIIDNKDAQTIAFVTQVGDIVDTCSDPEQWRVAKHSMLLLKDIVPFGIAVGNHDMVPLTGNSSMFQATFPSSLFAGCEWYGGSIKDNSNSWQTFSAGATDFLIVHIECNAPDDVLAWADGILNAHPHHAAIIVTHMYLGPLKKPGNAEEYFTAPKGRMEWKKCHGEAGNTPQEMWDKCFSGHANVFLILCGDQSRTQTAYQCSEGVKGNTVHELLSDYREGFIRVYRFLPSTDTLEVFTYSPTLGKLCDGTAFVPEREKHQFTVTCPLNYMRPGTVAVSVTP